MSENRSIVDEIQSILYAITPADHGKLRALANAYAEECEQANQRLRTCGRLLQQGLRSEAIQQSDIEPNLLDLTASLDFPELPHWIETLNLAGLPTPPNLLLDTAGDLNEAYALEQPLQSLLNNHRLLALARAPLESRIKTLRQIQARDPQNEVWRQDLAQYETARLEQINGETRRAFNAGDLAALSSLSNELGKPNWIVSPPSPLIERVTSQICDLRSQRAIEHLRAIEPQLTAAYSAFDVPVAKQLRRAWMDHLQHVTNGQTVELEELAAPALDWLADQEFQAARQEAHHNSQADMERALESDASIGELDKLYHRVLQNDQGIDEVLERRFRSRLRGHEVNNQRRFIGRVVVASLSILGVLAIVGGTIVYVTYRKDVGRNAVAVQKLLDTHQYELAKQNLQELSDSSPRTYRSAEIRGLRAELEKLIAEDESRREQFSSHLASVKEAIAAYEESAVGDGRPDKGALHRAETSLEAAATLAQVDEEKAALLTQDAQIAAFHRDLQERIDEVFLERLEALRKRITVLDRGEPPSFDSRQEELRQLKDLLGRLAINRHDVTEALYRQTEPLAARLAVIEEYLAGEAQFERSSESITASLRRWPNYVTALESYQEQFPDSDRSADFTIVVAEAEIWAAMDGWNDVVAEWSNINLRNTTSAEAAEAIELYENAIEHYPGYPQVEELAALLPYLQAIERRADDSEEKLLDRLESLFSREWLLTWWILETTDGTQYYTPGEVQIDRDRGSIDFSYFTGYDTPRPARIRTEKVGECYRSPQCSLARRVLLDLHGVGSHSWEQEFATLVSEIYEVEGIDPILKCILIKHVLSVGCSGSHAMEEAYADLQNSLNSDNLDLTVNWMDPDDTDSAGPRAVAEVTLSQLEELESMHQAAAASLVAIKEIQESRSLATSYECIGWLGRNQAGEWQCYCSREPEGTGELVVCYADASDNPLMRRVGEFEEGTVTISTISPAAMREGRPVYLQSNSTER